MAFWKWDVFDMGRTWSAIKDGMKHGIIFRADLKKYCTEREDVNPKTFNENIRRNVKKSGELADVVFKKKRKKIEVLLLRKKELWHRLEGINERSVSARNVAISSLQKRKLGLTCQYYLEVENLTWQPLQQVHSRLMLVDLQQSKILYDQDGVWSDVRSVTELFRGFPERLLAFEVETSTLMRGEDEWLYVLKMGRKERFNVDNHFMLIFEVYGKNCYGVKGFFLYHLPSSIETFSITGVKSSTYNITF